MRNHLTSRILLSAILLTSSLSLAVGAQIAGADSAGTCVQGSSFLADGLAALSVDGVPAEPVRLGVFADNASGESNTLSLCRDTGNHVYGYSVGRLAPDNTSSTGLSVADVSKSFTVSFTPQAGDVALTSENHARATAFTIDPTTRLVSVTASPLSFSDIYGNDCPSGTTPLQCAAQVTGASVDNPASLTGAVRYTDASGTGAAGFSDLPGMYTSSAAYVFFVSASCPTNSVRDPSFSGLKIDLGGPHLRHDGDPNLGYVSAYIPAEAVAACFGDSPAHYAANAVVSRTEDGSTLVASSRSTTDAGLHYVATADANGVLIEIPEVTFSQPTYGFGTKKGKALFRSQYALSTLAKNLKKPKGGKFIISVSTPKVCAHSASKLFGFKAGTCKYKVTPVKKDGTVLTSQGKAGTIVIR